MEIVENLLNYKPENQFVTKIFEESCIYHGKEKAFPYEFVKISLEDKIKILDKLTEGKSTDIFNLIDKFQKDKKDMKKDSLGRIKTVSLIAWINRNVNQSIIRVDNSYKYGKIYFLGKEHYIYNNYDEYDGYYDNENDYRDALFKALVYNLKSKEEAWFRDNDPMQIKFAQIKDFESSFGSLNSKIINNIYNGRCEGITEEQVDFYINKYKKLEEFREKIFKEVEEVENNYE